MTLPNTLLWIDLETAGLDPTCCGILEVAFGVAAFDRPFDLVRKLHFALACRSWSGVDDKVLEMHAKSGLINDCILSSTELWKVENHILESLPPDVQPMDVVLAGSSVHFDRSFVALHMKKLARLLHYRTYDVSAVRNFAYSLGMPEMPHVDSAHRAKADLEASVALGKTLAEWFAGTTVDQIRALTELPF